MLSAVPVALQLYSLREAAARDCRGVLERVARAGFLGVELASLHGNAPRAVRGWLEELGLVGVAVHRPMPLGDAANQILDELSELAISTLVVPWVAPERFQSAATIQALADDLLRANENAAARGIALGYHNHNFELESKIYGQSALVRLLGAVGPLVFAEVDVYWVRVGGVDPAALIAELGPQVRLLHIKDGPADGTTSPMTAVGTGVIDFPAIVAASTNVAWHIVELDHCATDMFEAVEASRRWLVSEGLSQGRG